MRAVELDARTIGDAVSELAYGTALARGYVRTYAAGRVEYSRHAREAYSYGRHFPLFRYVPKGMSGRGQAPLFVINGDRWRGSNSRTSDHQASARQAIENTGIASLILPFSALGGAGIDIDSIRVLDVQPDSWETVERCEPPHRVAEWRKRSQELDADGLYRWEETVHHLGGSLFTAVRQARRGRYVSSFDMNENPPLYFLCEVPRSGFASVAGAIDSLAPRAVHAAMLAGRQVERQGDVFFIETALTTGELAYRGATFARLTQWTRDAKPRRGEVTYTAPNRERERRVAVREGKYRRELFRQEWRKTLERVTVQHVPDAARREQARAAWQELRERHAAQLAACDAAGVARDTRVSLPCERCGAGAGEDCRTVDIPELGPRACRGADQCQRDLSYLQARELDAVRRDMRAPSRSSVLPVSARGVRAKYRKARAQRLAAIETARQELRAAVFGRMPRHWGLGGKPYGMSHARYRRWSVLQAVQRARQNLERASEPLQLSRVQERDSYRSRFGNNAAALYARCALEAQRKYRPETVQDTARAIRDRETVRRHLMVYGTAHSATEVARVGTAVYVRGTVRHAVELEQARRDMPDHRPLTLAPDVWYLAVRNTVPRQNRRRSRASA